MNRPAHLEPTARAWSAPEERAAVATRYGLPLAAFDRAWTLKEVQNYLQIGRTQAYALVNEPTFPPRLRTGRSHRWNGLQVLAWAHHDDWRTVCHLGVQPGQSSAMTTVATSRSTVPTSTLPLAAPTPIRRTPGALPSATRRLEPTGPREPVVTRLVDPAEVRRERTRARLADLVPDAADSRAAARRRPDGSRESA